MDLDEVDSTGVQTDNLLTGNPRSAGGGGNGSWACRLLWRGCDLARKAAIAGAAATAAPVVAPPLLVLSVAGVALSVPFAAYLASLAATNHLMDALLRSCYPPPQPYHHQEDDDDVEQEYLDASEEYACQAFGHLDTGAEQGEDEEGDASLLLPRDHGVSEALVPAFADEVEEEVRGEFFSSDQKSYRSNRGDETEEHTPVEGKQALPRSLGVSASAEPLFSEEDNLVQKKGEGEFPVLDSGQQSFQLQSENRNEKEDDLYSKNKEEDAKTMEEDKSKKDMVSEGFHFPEPRVPASGGDDNVFQERRESEFSVQDSAQYSDESNNWNEKEEVDGKTTEENKSAKEAVSQGFYVPELGEAASSDKDNTVQEKGEGELSAQNLGEYSLLSDTGDENELHVTMEEKNTTKDMPQRDYVVSESSVPVLHGEDNVVQRKEGFEVAVQYVLEEDNSNTSDLVIGELADVELEITTAIAAPESEVLPKSNLAAPESLVDLDTAELVDVDVAVAVAAEPESEVLYPTSESPFDPDTAESVDVQLEFISIAAPEGEVLHPINLVAHESPPDLVTGEVVAVQVDIVAAAAPESEVVSLSSLAALETQAVAETAHVDEVKNEPGTTMEENKSTEDMPPQDFTVSESPAAVFHGEDNAVQSNEGFEVAVQEVVQEANGTTDPVMGEVAEVQVEIIAIGTPETESEVLPPSCVVARELLSDLDAAAAPESGVLHPSNLTTSGSQAVSETAHAGEVTETTVMEDIVIDIGGVNKEGVSFVPVASVHDGEDVMSSGSTPYLSTVEEETIDQPNQSPGMGHAVMKEAFGSRDAAEGEADYTEEQLREQLDTIRTITGYGAVPSTTLEGELAGLYIFVGVEVEPAAVSGDTSDRLMELNARLRFLKSIIGVD